MQHYNENETFIPFNTRLIFYKDGHFEVRRYVEYLSKKKKGFEEVDQTHAVYGGYEWSEDQMDLDSSEKIFSPNITSAQETKEIRSDSLKRSRDILIDIGYENWEKWESFITLTFKDIVDIQDGNKELSRWLHSVKERFRRRNEDFYYLCIPEYQKRGSIHYHMLSNLVPGSSDLPKREIKWTLNTKTGNYVRLDYYNIPGWTLGFSSAFGLRVGDPNNFIDKDFEPVDYMCKYMFKHPDQRLWSNRKIIHSNNLDKPKYFYTSWESLPAEFIDKVSQFTPKEFKGDKDRYLPGFTEYSGKSIELSNLI